MGGVEKEDHREERDGLDGKGGGFKVKKFSKEKNSKVKKVPKSKKFQSQKKSKVKNQSQDQKKPLKNTNIRKCST